MKKVIKRIPFLPKPMLPPIIALRSVTSRSGKGVYASSDTLFRGAIFGRDSLEVAEDLLVIKPKLVKHIILTLGSLQGIHSSDTSEEEHGKIIHEYRTAIVDGKPLDDVSRHIFKELSSRWGGNHHEMAYYGSIDATPLFIRVAGEYCNKRGNRKILEHSIKRRDGTTVAMRDVLMLAVDWLTEKLANSSSGLLEYHARNPHGLENQAWKDSREFYVHNTGKLANRKQPIASVEVQGLAYDALKWGARLLPERAEELDKRAKQLRDRTIELLWLPKKHYFALGVDHHDDGQIRIMKTLTANPAALLDTFFFDELKDKKRKMYVSNIARNIMGSDFLTDAGIRSRSLAEKNVIKFWDYHGSFTSWPKETYDIAKGLRRQGFPKLAEQLENRILNVVRKSRGYPEFVYVDYRGRVMAGPPTRQTHGELSLIDSTNKPESIQAWTVSAVLAITTRRLPGLSRTKPKQKLWQKELEQEILSHIPRVQPLRSSKQLEARYPDYPYKLIRNNSKHSGHFSRQASES